jgi:hypothetical protein
MMDRPGRNGVIMIFLAATVGSRVTSVKSPMYGMMAAGLGNSTDIPVQSIHQKIEDLGLSSARKPEQENMTHLV